MNMLKNITVLFIFTMLVSGCVSSFSDKGSDPGSDATTVKSYMEKAQTLEARGRYHRAIELYDKALDIDPENRDAKRHKNNIRVILYDRAQKHYENGVLLERHGKYEEAGKEYRAAVEDWPDHEKARAKLSSAIAGSQAQHHIVHTLVTGETLSKLALIYYGKSTSYSIIGRYNNLKDVGRVRVGQKIKIPAIEGITLETLKRRQSDYAAARGGNTMVQEQSSFDSEPAGGVGQDSGMENEKLQPEEETVTHEKIRDEAPAPEEMLPEDETPAQEEMLPEEAAVLEEMQPESETPAPEELQSVEETSATEKMLPEDEASMPEEMQSEEKAPAPEEMLPEDAAAPKEDAATREEMLSEEKIPATEEMLSEDEAPAREEMLPEEAAVLKEMLPEEAAAAPEELQPEEEEPAPEEMLSEGEAPATGEMLPEEETPAPEEMSPEGEVPASEEMLEPAENTAAPEAVRGAEEAPAEALEEVLEE